MSRHRLAADLVQLTYSSVGPVPVPAYTSEVVPKASAAPPVLEDDGESPVRYRQAVSAASSTSAVRKTAAKSQAPPMEEEEEEFSASRRNAIFPGCAAMLIVALSIAMI